MSRALFMATLKDGLARLPQPEIDAVVTDYEFHFAEAIAAGQSEEDIVARLGDPAGLARELRGIAEQHHSAEGKKSSPMAPAAKTSLASGGRVTLGLLLTFLIVAGAVAAYYIVGQGDRGVSQPVASPPAASQHQAISSPATGARIVISGGQVVDLGTITQERIEILVDGGGRALARGRVKELTVHIDGSGSVDFGTLQADIVHVDLSGTGDANVFATQLADVSISGSGMVRLKVKPKLLTRSLVGSGRIEVPK